MYCHNNENVKPFVATISEIQQIHNKKTKLHPKETLIFKYNNHCNSNNSSGEKLRNYRRCRICSTQRFLLRAEVQVNKVLRHLGIVSVYLIILSRILCSTNKKCLSFPLVFYCFYIKIQQIAKNFNMFFWQCNANTHTHSLCTLTWLCKQIFIIKA